VVSLLDVLDAKAITIPHICLASPEEPAAVIELYANSLDKERAEFETYDTMFHGWMGARANLQDRRNAEEFDRGYG
jgi:dienelactone hydrolase